MTVIFYFYSMVNYLLPLAIGQPNKWLKDHSEVKVYGNTIQTHSPSNGKSPSERIQGPQRRFENSWGPLLQHLPMDTCKGLLRMQKDYIVRTLELCSPGHTIPALSARLCKTQSTVSALAPAMLLEAPHHETRLWPHHSTPSVLLPLPSHVTETTSCRTPVCSVQRICVSPLLREVTDPGSFPARAGAKSMTMNHQGRYASSCPFTTEELRDLCGQSRESRNH